MIKTIPRNRQIAEGLQDAFEWDFRGFGSPADGEVSSGVGTGKDDHAAGE